MTIANNNQKLAASIRDEKEINKGNRIILVKNDGTEEQVSELKNVQITFVGGDSIVKIHESYNIAHMRLYVGEGGYIEIGRKFTVRFHLYIDAKADNTTVRIGDFVNIGRGEIYAGDEQGLEVIIGNNFMTSLDMYLRNADGHTIYDIKSREPVNRPIFGVHIGDNVWCGYGVTILKDADIPSNCILGACSVVGKGSFEENSIIAGVPARTIRTGVMWDKRTVTRYIAEENT